MKSALLFASIVPASLIRRNCAPLRVAATRNGAQFLRLTDVGTIEANKSADFLVLDANPLDNITNTRKIASVYLRGSQIDRNAFRVNSTQ